MHKLNKNDLKYIAQEEIYIFVSDKGKNSIFKVNVEKTRGHRDIVFCNRYNTTTSDSISGLVVITPMLFDYLDFYIITKEDDPEYFI